MPEQKESKGTFLQLPTVFIETCDIAESAQIMYIRMLNNFGYKGVFVGSIRKLAKIVRMPKSTADRLLDTLVKVNLVSRNNTIDGVTDREALMVSLDPEILWDANKEYCTNGSVPIWDSGKKKVRGVPNKDEVSQFGTKCPTDGTESPNLGQSVPNRELKQGSYITKTSKINNIDSKLASTSKKNHLKLVEGKPTQPKLPVSGIALSEEEQSIFDEWCKMPWFNNVIPDLQRNDPEHLRKLAAYKPTAQTMLQVKNWATSKSVDRNGFYKGKKWSLFWLVREYPNWLSTQHNDTTSQNGHTADNRPSPTVSELQNNKNMLRAAKVSREKRIERGDTEGVKNMDRHIAELEAEIARLSPSSQVAS